MHPTRIRALSRRCVGILAAVLACGLAACDDPSGSTPPVAKVLLDGVPTTAVRVGATAQLRATALSGSGSTISGAPVAWTSSDDAVATVGADGVLTGRGAGTAQITASSGTASATAEVRVVAPLVIDLAGGTFSLPDGSVSVTVPGGLGNGTVTYLVGPGPASLGDPRVVPGTIYEIDAETGFGGFLPGATLTLRYDPARLPAGVTAGGLQLYGRSQSAWSAVLNSASDPDAGTVTGRLPGTGVFAVRFTPVDRVVLSGAQVDGALYVGQTAQLRAAAVSAAGDTLGGHTPAWSTSAAGVAAVDARGVVTAVGPGTATLTATAGGASATTQVQVLSRPVPSWNGALDWTTHRGNNRRTGYVDATLDPVSFARRWEVTVSSSALNEPATGNGNVYVSSDAYFGSQALWALSSADGSLRWTRTFGQIHSVNGPATGNGRVYVSTGGHEDSFLWSMDAADGTVRFRSAYGNQWSRWHAPAVTSDVVFLGGGYYGGMSAYDALEGTRLWTRGLPQEDRWTPAADGGKVYAFGYVAQESGLLALDGRTGAATLELPNRGLPSAGTPVLGGGGEVYLNGGGRLLALDLAGDAMTWERPGGYQGVPALDGTRLYSVVDGQVEARSRATGERIWTWVPQAGSAAAGSVIVTRNLLFVRLVPSGYTGSSRVVALDLATQKVVWGYDADGEIALGDGLLLIASRSTGKVTAIAVR